MQHPVVLKRMRLNVMIEAKLEEKYKDYVLSVWFEVWRYDRDKYMALIPFLRQLSIKLENQPTSNTGTGTSSPSNKWVTIKKGVERTLRAMSDSVDQSLGIGSFASAKLDIMSFKNSLDSDGSTKVDGETIQFYEHPTDHLRWAIDKVRNSGNESKKVRIVIFVDDLDRCTPDKDLEVLESIKAFLDIDGIVYVIAMDSSSIDSIIGNKFGPGTKVTGIDYLQKIVQLPFQVPTCFLNRQALELLKLGKIEDAIVYLDKILEIDEKNVMVLSMKGSILLRLGKTEDAITWCEVALENHAENILALITKGAALLKLGLKDKALISYEKAVQIDAKSVDETVRMFLAQHYLDKGHDLSNSGRDEDAISLYDKAMEMNPMNVTALKKKAFALLNLKRTEEAVVSFEKALQIDANSVEAPIKKFLIQYYSLKGGATKAAASESSEDGSGESEDA